MPTRPIIDVIKNRDFILVPADASVRHTARLMKQHRQGAALVVDDGCLQGICTERDLAFDVLAEGLAPDRTPVRASMTPAPPTIGPDKPFGHAMHLMFEGGFRHVPVVDGSGRPLGIVSARDALGLEVIEFTGELERREALTEIL